MIAKLPFLKSHVQRLLKGAELLHFVLPASLNLDYMEQEIKKITRDTMNARIRFVLFRKDGGLYTPVCNDTSFLIEFETLTTSFFEYPEEGLTMGICPYPLVAFHHLSAIKSCNRLPNSVAAIYARQNKLQDCLMLDKEGYIAESSSSNIFFLRENHLITPPVSSGCIDGSIRTYILENAVELGFTINETPVNKEALSTFNEVFLTNAIQGIRPVKQIEDINFDIVKSNVFLSALNEFVRQ